MLANHASTFKSLVLKTKTFWVKCWKIHAIFIFYGHNAGPNVEYFWKSKNNFYVNDIRDLTEAGKNDVTFLHSKKYSNAAKNTKSKLIITNQKIKTILSNKKYINEEDNKIQSLDKKTEIFYQISLNQTLEIH
mgnify:CR=1 FL=1